MHGALKQHMPQRVVKQFMSIQLKQRIPPMHDAYMSIHVHTRYIHVLYTIHTNTIHGTLKQRMQDNVASRDYCLCMYAELKPYTHGDPEATRLKGRLSNARRQKQH